MDFCRIPAHQKTFCLFWGSIQDVVVVDLVLEPLEKSSSVTQLKGHKTVYILIVTTM
jgi:hypothetical protein